MADLNLKGTLKFAGSLDLLGSGGKVKVDGKEALVVGATGTGTPILLPPPPAKPTDDGTDVKVTGSLNQTVTAKGKPIVVALSEVKQGNSLTYPGTVDPGSSTVQVNGGKISLVGAQATIPAQTTPPIPSAVITESGQ